VTVAGTTNQDGIDFGLNKAPTANDDGVNNQIPGSPATVSNILSNDNDPNGGTLSADSITLILPSGATDPVYDADGDLTGFTVPNEGTWVLNPDGSVTFTPESGFTGDPTPITYTVTDNAGLVSNVATITVDYATAASISGTVYNDNNGMTDGVNGTAMSGIDVTLYAADGTTVMATTTTNGSGDYSFTNVIPGDYIVGVTAPAGYSNVSSTDATPTDGVTNVTVAGTTNQDGI